jgi:transcriptional antiterminator NusG
MIYTDDSWYVVRNTRGVTGFVGPGSEPTPLSEEEVMALGVDIVNPVVQLDLKEGDSVEVCGTAMDGFVGVVQTINLEDETVDVLVSMFGRDTQATLALNQVKKLED